MDNTRLKQIGEEFGRAIAELVSKGLVRIGTVKTVEESFAEVVLTDGDSPIRIPLQLLKLEKALLRVRPKKDSTVAVLFVEGARNMPMFVGLTEVEEYKLQVGESLIRIEDGLIEFNEGKNKGMVLAESIKDRLNKVEDDINALKSAIASWTPAPNDGGALLKEATLTWSAQRLVSTQLSDIENDKITQ